MPDEVKNNQTGDGFPQFDWRQGSASWTELNMDAVPAAEAEPEPQAEAAPKKAKKQPMSTRDSILAAVLYVVGVLMISFCIATVGWKWGNDFLALDKGSYNVSITIDENESLDEVADDLYINGLIEYRFLFKLFAGFTHKADRITTGTYELSTEMDYSALLTGMSARSSYRETVTVTIPEGFTVEEIFALLDEKGVCSKQKLMDAAQNTETEFVALKGIGRKGLQRLEGYLFPDTYEFYMGTDPETVLRKLLNNFADRFDAKMEAEMQIQGYTMDQVIIVASIIEKETTGDDRNDISSVIHNRLTNPSHPDTKGFLQMDSTVQYCLEERKERLSNKDLEVDSPYNTYMYPGLPAGPICCPGLASIKAALEPHKTGYYFFMLGDDGEDHFFEGKSAFEKFKAAQTRDDED